MQTLTRKLEPGTAAMVLGITAMSALDAIFTLTLISTGLVHEWNPVMDALIQNDVQMFAWLKTGLTSGGALVLASVAKQKLFGSTTGRRLLELVTLIYTALMLYHSTLLIKIFLG